MPRRDVITVSGADARSYLHGQLAQDIAGLAVGDSRWALLLEPNGRVNALVRVSAQADGRFAIDVDAGFGRDVEARINRFRIRVDVTTTPAEDVDVDPEDLVGWWADGRAGRSWAVDVGDAPDDLTLEARRVAAGWPAMGREIQPGVTLAAETGVVDVAVRFGKGCYPGQELVERMDARGAAAPRRLVRLPAADLAVGLAAGDPVLDADGTEVGTVTTVAGDWALAIVGRAATVGEPVGPHLILS